MNRALHVILGAATILVWGTIYVSGPSRNAVAKPNASERPATPEPKQWDQDYAKLPMSFEANRFWDLRRWKRSIEELNKVIQGWDIAQASPGAYYRPRALFTQTFQVRDYLWPIRSYDILVNPKLVQNPGW